MTDDRVASSRISMKQLIIYDLDGTLVDTKDDIAAAANHMLRCLQRPTLPTQEICRYVGLGVQQLVERCLQTDRAELVGEGLALYRAYYGAHLMDQSRLYPDVREVLEYFQPRTQAVVTNKPDPYAREILTRCGVADYFLEIIADNSAFPKKPDPTAVRFVMERARAAPDTTLLIGDSPIDIETGRHSGVVTVGIAQGFADDEALLAAQPAVLVRNFQELLLYARRAAW